jgi:hypothetical protein
MDKISGRKNLYQGGPEVHEKRFDSIDKFPSILGQNKKYGCLSLSNYRTTKIFMPS